MVEMLHIVAEGVPDFKMVSLKNGGIEGSERQGKNLFEFSVFILQKVPSHSYDLFWQFCQHVDRSIPYLQGENKITNIFLKVKKFLA